MNPPPFNRKEAAELLRDSSTLGTTVLVILLQTYGEELFDLDPLEIYARVQEDFRATLSEEGENRLNALLFAISSDAFYEDPEVFRAVSTSLYDGDLGDLVTGGLEPITVPEMLWAVYEVGQLREDEPDFTAGINRIMDETIADEAEEQDMENVEVLPYYERFLESTKKDLFKQLSSIGVSKQELLALGATIT
jgi:hypothetical protein